MIFIIYPFIACVMAELKTSIFGQEKEKDFYCTIFEHDEEEIERKRTNLKIFLKDNPYFNISG